MKNVPQEIRNCPLPKLCFVGPLVGHIPGKIPSPAEFHAEHLAQAGYSVMSVSHHPNRYMRLLDIMWTLLSKQNMIDIQVLQIFCGPSFVVEDVASLLGKLSHKKIVMVLHGGDMPRFARRFPNWTRRVLQRADRIITPSAYLKRELAWLGFPMQIILNVIDFSHYPYRHRSTLRPRLFWMRSFHEIYNPEMAVRVVEHLRPLVPDIHLTMAGSDKGLLEPMRSLAQERGLRQQITFPGFLDFAGKIRAGEENDIYINTNRIDNMPVSILETCAMGMPVVATEVGGIADLLTHEETGLLVPDNDDLAMAQAIQRLLNDAQLAERLSTNGRKLAEQCAWERIKPQWEQVFADLQE